MGLVDNIMFAKFKDIEEEPNKIMDEDFMMNIINEIIDHIE